MGFSEKFLWGALQLPISVKVHGTKMERCVRF